MLRGNLNNKSMPVLVKKKKALKFMEIFKKWSLKHAEKITAAALCLNLCPVLQPNSCRRVKVSSVWLVYPEPPLMHPTLWPFWLSTIWTTGEDSGDLSHGLILPPHLVRFLPPPPPLLFASLYLVLLWRWKMQREINHSPCHLISEWNEINRLEGERNQKS